MKRVCPLENNSFHHIYNKSIYGYTIFNCKEEYQRMLELIEYYRYEGHIRPFSYIIKRKTITPPGGITVGTAPLVNIIAYCLMPTHVHFILQQLISKGIETFMRRTLNAYSNYFNLRHNRRGPLWQNRFGNRIILDIKGLNDRIQYVHYNPVKENLIKTPEEWPYSSAPTPLHLPEV